MLFSKTLTDKLSDAWSDYSKIIRERETRVNPMTLEESMDYMNRKESVLYRIALLSEAVDIVKNGAGIPSSKIML
jgi:uncharacterized HAD superfamily protein